MKQLSEHVLSASVVMLIGTALYIGITIAIQSFIGHIGGPSALGQYTAALMAIEFLSTIILFGTVSALNREVSVLISTGHRQETSTLLSGLLAYLFGASLLVGILMPILFASLQNIQIIDTAINKADLFSVIIGSFALVISKSITVFYYAGFKNTKGIAITLVGPILTGILAFMSFRESCQITLVQAVGWGFIASAIFAIVLSIRDRHFPAKPQWGKLRSLLKFSFPLFGVSILAFASTWLDRILIGMMKGIADLGVLTSAVVIVRAIRFVPQVLTPVFVTTYSRIHTNSTRSQKLTEFFSMDLFFVSLFCLVSASAIYIWAQNITLLVWGKSFANITTTILRIELIGLVGLAYSLQTPNVLVAMGRPELNFKLAITHVSIQLVLSIVLLRMFGIVGVALGTSLTVIIMGIVRHRVITRKLGVEIKSRPIKKLIATFIISITLYHASERIGWLPSIGTSILSTLAAICMFLAVLFSNRSAISFFTSIIRRVCFQGRLPGAP